MRRNMCGTAQVSPHASRAARTAPALLLWSHTRSGSRCEDVTLGAAVGGARRQLRHEPLGQIQPPGGGFALGTAPVDAAARKVDVLPSNAPRLVDPGPGSCQERNKICRRTALAPGCGDSTLARQPQEVLPR